MSAISIVFLVLSDYYLRILFPDALPSTSEIHSGKLSISDESCLEMEVYSMMLDTRTFGGATLSIKLDYHDDYAVILHNQYEQNLVKRCRVALPAGNYSLSIMAKGNMFSRLGIDNIYLDSRQCRFPGNWYSREIRKLYKL